jgi:hypothetical protein
VAPVTHQPAPGDTQGNVSRQLAGAVVFGAELRPLLQFEWRRKTRGAQAFRRRVGWPSYAACSRAGQEEQSRCFTRVFFSFQGDCVPSMNTACSCFMAQVASDVAISKH